MQIVSADVSVERRDAAAHQSEPLSALQLSSLPAHLREPAQLAAARDDQALGRGRQEVRVRLMRQALRHQAESRLPH